MLIIMKGHKFNYTLKNICYLFFPGQKITAVQDQSSEKDNVTLFTQVKEENNGYFITAQLQVGSKTTERTCKEEDEKKIKTSLAKLCFFLLQNYTKITPPWGTLTGVKPVKLYLLLCKRLKSENEAEKTLRETYLVSEEKIKLIKEVVNIQKPYLAYNNKRDCSVYVSIPFCPSRCSYCSFVSHSVEKQGHLVEPHLECLLRELEMTKRQIDTLGFRVNAIYIGGGTPTILTAEQLNRLLTKIDNLFDAKNVKEYTLEAGRPDTIDREKLVLAKQKWVTRLNINPQSLNDTVLTLANRRHTAKDIIDKVYLARELGFDNINMDLIAGLKGDNFESFQNTLAQVVSLKPQNITVHTLYMKRASKDVQEEHAQFKAQDTEVGKMVGFAAAELKKAGYSPFYMYRQRNTVDNLENTGYTLNNCESPYNIWMMDDTHTVFACGAGAVTKLVDQSKNKIERLYNYKLPLEYLKKFSHIEQKLKKTEEFFKS